MTTRQDLIECERYFIGVKSINGNVVRYKSFPVRCDTWDCPLCSRIKAEKYKLRMKPLFEHPELYFYTFTYYHNKPPVEVWSSYSRAWNRFRTAATKAFGSFRYVRVLEHHKNSPYPHLHVVADKRFTDVWLAKELMAAGFGYQCTCKRVYGGDAARYITKYLTKGWSCETSKNLRKALRLRIISFGGIDGRDLTCDTSWNLVTRALCGDEVYRSIVADITWDFGLDAALTYEKKFDAFAEYTYTIAKGGLSGDDVTKILPIP